MSDRGDPEVPSDEEIAAAKAAFQEFIERQQAVPEAERTVFSSAKFDGPIGEPEQSEGHSDSEAD